MSNTVNSIRQRLAQYDTDTQPSSSTSGVTVSLTKDTNVPQTDWMKYVAPKHLRANLKNCGKKSVLFSPRTAINRREVRNTSQIVEKSKSLPDTSLIDSQWLLIKRLGIDQSTSNLISLECQIHRTKMTNLLHQFKREHHKTQTMIENRLNKTMVRRSIDYHIQRVVNEKNRQLLLKRAKLTYQNALKMRQTSNKVPSHPMPNGGVKLTLQRHDKQTNRQRDAAVWSPTTDTTGEFCQAFYEADEEASKYLKQLAEEHKHRYEDVANSTENAAKNKIDIAKNTFYKNLKLF